MSEQSTKINIDKLTGNVRISRKERYELLFKYFELKNESLNQRFDKITRDLIHAYLTSKQVDMNILHKRIVNNDEFHFWLNNIP